MATLLRISEVADLTGLSIHTVYRYHSIGIFPPPRERIGMTCLWARPDVVDFKKRHRGNPNARKSVRVKRAVRRKR